MTYQIPLYLPIILGNRRRFYVDFTLGDDGNSGRSPGAAWKTVAAVNAYADFASRDQVLFKRGETWTLAAAGLVVPRNGLTFDAYGSGAVPVIDGNRAIANVFDTNGKNGLNIGNLHIKSGTAAGLLIGSSHEVMVGSVEASDCGNDNIRVTQNSYGCELHSINSHDDYDAGSDSEPSLLEIKDGCHDITVDGATLSGGISSGLHIVAHNPLQGDCFPYNITARNLAITNCVTNGILVSKQNVDVDTDRNINIEDFTVVTNGLYATLVNEASGAGVLQGVKYKRGILDATAVAGHYSAQILGKAYFERCVFLASNYARVDAKGDFTAYNCVFYRNTGTVLVVRNSPVSTVFRNSIFYATGTNIVDYQSITGAEDVDYNLYYATVGGNNYKWNGTAYSWANWKSISGQDAHSPTPADPLFVAVGTDFHLQAGSPAIDAGVDVGLSYSGAAPDCGAYEKA